MLRSRITSLLVATILSAATSPAMAQWPTSTGTDLVVTNSAWYSGSQSVADGAGGLIVVWTDMRFTGSPTAMYAQRFDAAGNRLWAANGALVEPLGDAMYGFRICPDDSNGVVVAWYRGVGSSANRIRAQRLDALGQRRWGASGVRVATDESSQVDPRITRDGAGGVVVAWTDSRYGFFDRLYTQRLTAAGVRLWGDGGLHVAGSDYVRTAELATRDAGGAYLAWWGNSALVRCGALDLAGTALWANAALTSVAPTTTPPTIAIIADGVGGAFAMMEDANKIFYRRLASAGPLALPSGPLNSGTWSQGNVQLAADGVGGVFLSWLDNRLAFDSRVAVQHLRADDSQAWAAGGLLLPSTVTNTSGSHAIASDGGGGLLTTFATSSGGKAERLSGGGLSLWSTTPATFTLSTTSYAMTLVPTLESGGIVVWQNSFTVYAKRLLGNGGLSTVGVEHAAPPIASRLHAPTPNPSRGAVALQFELAEEGPVRLVIHDMQGRLVQELARGSHRAGVHHASWDARDSRGERLAPGVYFARLESRDGVRRQRVVVLR